MDRSSKPNNGISLSFCDIYLHCNIEEIVFVSPNSIKKEDAE